MKAVFLLNMGKSGPISGAVGVSQCLNKQTQIAQIFLSPSSSNDNVHRTGMSVRRSERNLNKKIVDELNGGAPTTPAKTVRCLYSSVS